MKGKRFGPPPKKGPQAQGFSKGGSRNATSQEQAFFKESFNRHFLSTPAGSNNLRIFSPAHINTIMGKVVQDFEGRGGRRGPSTNMNAGYVAKESETGVNTKKVTGLDTKKLTGMNSGRLVEPKLKQRPVKKIQTLPSGRTENRTEYSKTIKTKKGFTNVPSLYDNKELNEDDLTKMYSKTKTDPSTNRRVKTYKTAKEAVTAAKRRSNQIVRRNKGGMGCPHRERGVKSDIKGISPIQLKGKKFIGVK
tara:strand:- start:1132 stop:1878 length:747 start_codon:yes stop_codon:yes gene_type:complete